MKLTIEDIRNFPEFKGLRLIAGGDGTDRVVTSCGILDYEFDSNVKEKYSSINFQKDQLVLTSFLYAKNNEYLVMDAVKRLISKGCSGIAVKNIFRLPFHDNLLRYADSMRFPIFLIEDPGLYFENMIIRIKERGDQYTSLHYRASKVDEMLAELNAQGSPAVLLNLAREINVSLGSDFLALSFHSRQLLDPKLYFELETLFYRAGLLEPGSTILFYQNGFLLVHSSDMFSTGNVNEIIRPYMDALGNRAAEFYVGVSALHHDLAQLGNAFQECLYAQRIHRKEPGCPWRCYDEIGVYQFLLPFAESEPLRCFSQRYLHPLMDYDAENKSNLFPTAVRFVLCGGSIEKTAEALGQHKNTVRYRLERMSRIYGFSLLQPEHYEKLSMAVKIWLCFDENQMSL